MYLKYLRTAAHVKINNAVRFRVESDCRQMCVDVYSYLVLNF